MNDKAPSQANIDEQREQLRQNLNALEDRVNPAKIAERTKEKIRRDPAPWVAAVSGVAVLIGGIVTVVVLRRR